MGLSNLLGSATEYLEKKTKASKGIVTVVGLSAATEIYFLVLVIKVVIALF